MSVTVTQAIANTRQYMDAVSSTRWTDPLITNALGVVCGREWGGILAANSYYRFAQRTVTLDANTQFAYTALNAGSGDTAQTWNRILSITDGQTIYRQTAFMDVPLATTANYNTPYQRLWYDAGDNVQVLPVGSTGTTLIVTVNWTPPRADQLSAPSVTIDFPDGHEVILWLEAAAMLYSKGGAENDAGQTMRAMADQERQQMYSDLARRAATPQYLQFSDRVSDWAG